MRFVDALPEMNAAHEADQRAAHLGERSAVDSRRLLNRALIAVALANMAGRAVLISDDWRLAGAVLAHSDAVLDDLLATAEQTAEERKAAAEAERERKVRDSIAKARAVGDNWGTWWKGASNLQRVTAQRLGLQW